MRRSLFLIFLLTLSLSVLARTWKVSDIPNVHLADSTQFVSDPDGILSPDAKAAINSSMRSIRKNTSAEAVVVIVDDIDGGDIDGFATELFTDWGLGKKDVDNGLLILVAKDLRRAAIRPGYGLEGVLPDITCAAILREDMFPRFREGDYGAGLASASQTISTILTDPDAAAEIRSRLEDPDYNGGTGEDDLDFFQVYLIFMAVLSVTLVIILLLTLAGTRGKSRHDRYLALAKLKSPYLALSFLGLGMPLVASLPLIIILYHLRNSPHKCPNCGTSMKKIDEVHDNEYLDPTQDLEERIGSVDYDVWLCPSCGETDIEQYVTPASGYSQCPYCHAYASRLVRRRILRQPTTALKGFGVNEYTCLNCHKDHDDHFELPKLDVAPAVIAGSILGSSRRGGGFGGGGFGGGSFGGGMTGGGGASGGW